MRRRLALDLYLVTDRAMCAALGVERMVGEAVAGGVTAVQLRDDDTPTGDLVELARRLVALLAPAGVPLIVNNRLDVAVASGAAGIHVGQSDAPPGAARARLGPDAVVGLSITDPAQVAVVPMGIVDYLGVGPVFATATKADAAPPMGLAGLAAVRARTPMPIVAIGGMSAANAAAAIAAGADGVAVVSALCAAPEPRAAARSLAAIVAGAKGREAGR
jgi:thiamine-phosphate pyrophosphorylase